MIHAPRSLNAAMTQRTPRSTLLALLATALFAPGTARAIAPDTRPLPQETAAREPRVFEVKAGDSWESLATTVAAGDEIVLLDGVHRSATLTGLRGSADRPIVIRSAERSKLAEIAPDREGLKLVNCRHVRIERLVVRNARRAGLVIESTAPGASEHIDVVDTLVVSVEGLVEQCGLLVLGASDVRVQRCRFENCRGSALRVERSARLDVRRVQIRNAREGDAGVLLLGDCDELAFDDLWIGGPFATALSIGAKDAPPEGERVAPMRLPEPVRGPQPAAPSTPTEPAPEAASPPRAASEQAEAGAVATPRARIRTASFTNILARGATRMVELGSCEAVRVSNSTFLDAREEFFRIVRVPKDRPAAEVRFHDNLLAWEPGTLKRFASVIEGASDRGLRLGPNLWWSNELPAALPLLGPEGQPFPGAPDVPQTIDVDPDLDDFGRPRREEAKLFGRNTT
jgi:hypothetical protein